MINYGKANLRGNLLYPRFMTNIFDSLPQNAVFFVWTDTVGMAPITSRILRSAGRTWR